MSKEQHASWMPTSAAASVPLVSDLARRTAARTITLDYRLAPEHPYPAAVEDARAAYEGLLAQGIAHAQIALAGESAEADWRWRRCSPCENAACPCLAVPM